jgi:hypothetical protein
MRSVKMDDDELAYSYTNHSARRASNFETSRRLFKDINTTLMANKYTALYHKYRRGSALDGEK